MADGIRVERIAAQLPALKISQRVMSDVGKIAEGNILDNISSQRQATGVPIKQNAPSTLERKRKLGRPLLSLVDRLHRFVRGNKGSWRWRATTKAQQANLVIEPATADLRNLVRWVQEKGYVGWFALSNDGRDAIRVRFRKWIRDEFRKAARKPGKRVRK